MARSPKTTEAKMVEVTDLAADAALQDAPAEVTPEVTPVEEEVFISEQTKAEMSLGAAMLRKAQEQIASE